MKNRTPLIAANWKMNEPPVGAYTTDSPYRSKPSVDVWVFPSFLDVVAAHFHGLVAGAQCGNPMESGAYTGDISMKMLADQHIHAVLCGHSEHRKYHQEKDASIAAQVEGALKVGLQPILCVGETAEQRENGEAKDVVKKQITAINYKEKETYIISYEPVWAIGTGVSATAADAEEMQSFIRSLLPEPLQLLTRILYGGSANPENAAEFLKQPDVDGLLVGAASLNPEAFRKIVECAGHE